MVNAFFCVSRAPLFAHATPVQNAQAGVAPTAQGPQHFDVGTYNLEVTHKNLKKWPTEVTHDGPLRRFMIEKHY